MSGSFLSSMKIEASRKKMKAAIDGVNKNNLKILDELTQKRHESSLLLNYTNFAERQLKDKMA